MARYRHHLAQSDYGPNPRTVIVVDCVSTLHDLDGRNIRRCEQLASWTAAKMVFDGTRYNTVATVCGPQARGLWMLLEEASRTRGTTWVLSYRCTRVWALLGMWQRIEGGYLELRRTAPTEGTADFVSVSGVRESDSLGCGEGYPADMPGMPLLGNECIIIEDPPCLIAGWIRGCKGKLLWLDSRNHGVTVPVSTPAGCDTVTRLAAWWGAGEQLLTGGRLGPWRVTAGSQVIQAIKGEHWTAGVYCHNNKRALALEGNSYIGGRTSCFRMGELPGNVWHFDYRSLYPSICVNYDIPCALLEYTEDANRAAKLVRNDPLSCIAEVTIDTDRPDYPYRHKGNPIFPVGRWRGTLAGPELQDALSSGRIALIHRASAHRRSKWLAAVAGTLYRMRLHAERQDDEILKAWSKSLLVVIAGKIGQRERKWVSAENVQADGPYGEWPGVGPDGKPCKYRSIAWHVQRNQDMGWAEDAVPAAASWITSMGRMRLLEAIRTAGWEEVYYVDTDSVICSERGAERLQASVLCHGDELGSLTVRASGIACNILGPKYYESDGRLVCAGLPRGEWRDAGDGRHFWYTAGAAEQLAHGLRPESIATLRGWHRDADPRNLKVDADGWVVPEGVHEG